MSSRRPARQMIVAVMLGVLVGGGLMAITPAGAQVNQALETNWKKIWRKELKPLANKSYYKKAETDAKYASKTESAASAAAAQSAANAATDSKLGGYYKKSEIDAKLAPLVNSVAATSGGLQNEGLAAADEVVRSVSIMPPANGTVIVSSSAYVWATAAGPSDVIVRCSITTGSTVDTAYMQYANMPDAVSGESDQIAGTRGYAVTKGNLLTVNLVCDAFQGAANAADSAMTAIFAPS